MILSPITPGAPPNTSASTPNQQRKLDDGSTHEVLKNFPGASELIQRASRIGWGANVDLLQHYWLLTFWAPK